MQTTVSALDDLGDRSAPPGSRDWAVALRLDLQSALHDERFSAERLGYLCDAMRKHEGYRHLRGPDERLFATFEAFCVAAQPFGLGYDPRAINQIVEERRTAQAHALSLEKPAEPVGTAGPGRGHKTHVDNRGFIGSTNAEYLTGRIARDRDDVFQGMKRGEFGSVRAAAKAAGIVKERWSVPAWSIPRMAAYLRRKLPPDDRAALIEALQ